MTRLMLTGALVLISSASYADGRYWVVGNRATGKCDIVTANPVIGGGSAYDNGRGYSFGDGPYRSKDDAKLARTTIGVCPKVEDPADK
ncbi:MAG TPA: hypothetical protein VGH70_09270 [Bradyrhizobium sp.]